MGARKRCIVGERRDETRRDETQTRQNETRRDPDETRDETRPRLGESGENGENGTLVSYWTVISSLGISHPRYAVPFGNSKDIYIYIDGVLLFLGTSSGRGGGGFEVVVVVSSFRRFVVLR